MYKLKKLLETEPYVLLDGAMGTMLMEVGLEPGAPPEAWNISHPDRIIDVHRRYIEAGSRIILTNTFGGSRFRLKLHDLHDQVHALNAAAATNARKAASEAPHPVIVGGSIGPTGELLVPLGAMTFEDAEAAFAEQAAGLAEGGVDLFWIETMSDLGEVKAAISGARSVSDKPIVATMTFDTNGHTMMGVSPTAAIEALDELDLVAIGGNCGNGPHEIENVIRLMRQVRPDVLLVAKSNAGIPKWENDELIYDGSPEVMAGYASRVHALGARLIGGCCGSTPVHFRAMAAALANPDSVQGAPVPAGEPKGITASKARSVRERRFRRRPR
jgi:methionine synthase I (cobalamin-dependent)